MATAARSAASMPSARKKVFRSTAGLTIDQQLQMTAQLQAQGDDVLKTIRQMKKTSKNQKQTTKTNTLKNCSKDLESLLLRMYNEASTARESSTNNVITPRSGGDNQRDVDDDSGKSPVSASISTSTIYAAELEDLIRTEQLNRVALINQVASEREQRAALKQFLSAFTQEHGNNCLSEEKPRSLSKEMQVNVRQLIYDAVIGRQMIEATLEEKVQSCEREFDACYRKVLDTLRSGASVVSGDKQQSQEQRIAAMLDAAGANECADEMLRLEIYQAFQKVFDQLEQDLAEDGREFVSAASASDAAGNIEAASSRSGGWNEAEEELFLTVLRSYEKKQGAGKNSLLLYDQLALVLPTVPLLEIKKHVKFHQHLRFFQEKRKDRQRAFKRKVDELQSKASCRFRLSAEQEKERVRRLQELSEMQQQCEQRHQQVSQWRETKEAKERIERQQREIEQLLETQRQREGEVQWQRRHDQQKYAVDEYKKGKILQKIAEENRTMEEEQRRERERALQSVVNAERVQYRHDELQRKMDELKHQELDQARLEEQRLARLNELKETTPYAQIVANITPDPERTRQETAAFRANVEATQEGLPITETGLFPSHGYDCETLFKNARFKLGIALRNAGLNSSEYARQALANVKVCNVGAYRNHVAEPTKLW
ncbi:uncharacterized protein PITG_16392 [Phytophthora infestans T30-4]|uniref:Coiled-coil domain-containing protein n=1 Tax=Phytophthora infestans (strain T30-4) TaxID=403677 RepID=D0NU63_PHYIT|nr:uncharacterized protein PITG_16392 [Phytophthora infestans T30-4]EEY65187.1 conserved hypothetical protein [Phytophthora infestans T30-4]|eukprot:XP_002897444.1 conserved hypothetical protein [Phytophthora infestans T30-4]